MMIADAIAQTAWNATKEFKGETFPDRLRLMLEFLTINQVETLSDNDQAAVIRSCRKLASGDKSPVGYAVILVEPDRMFIWGASVLSTAQEAEEVRASDQAEHFPDKPGILKVYEIREVR